MDSGRKVKLSCCIIFILVYLRNCCAIQCKNPDGHDIDWFIIYKLPKISGHTEPDVKRGAGYFYMDVTMTKWKPFGVIDSKDLNPLRNTLMQIYENNDLKYAMYNDQPPESQPASHAHAHSKGVMAFDNDHGFWLMHSLPRYPPRKSQGYSFPVDIDGENDNEEVEFWPTNGYPYGQTFLCVTYLPDVRNQIVKQLLHMRTCVYDRNMTEFGGDFVQLRKCVQMAKTDGRNGETLTSMYKTAVLNHFAKSASYEEDLYTCFVADHLKISMKAETWKRPSAKIMDNSCPSIDTIKVSDINGINFEDFGADINFKSTKDHSKWAIAEEGFAKSSKYWTCIGDINRMDSQKTRGGGTACINNEHVWKSFYAIHRVNPRPIKRCRG